MKSRISKILGVLVTLTILASLVVTGTALPASAALGTLDYGSISTPSMVNNVFVAGVHVDFLVATADGSTMFAWDNATGILYKSTNSGATWAIRAAVAVGLPLATALVGNGMFISPAYATDSTIVAIEATKVWISQDGGNNFYEIATSDLTTKMGVGGTVTSVDMGVYYASGKMNILIGTAAGAANTVSNVLRFEIATGFAAWTPVGDVYTPIVGPPASGIGDFSVLAARFSPVNTADSEVLVIVNNAGVPTLYSSFAGAGFINLLAVGAAVPAKTIIAFGTDYNGLASNTFAVGLSSAASAGIWRVTGRSSGAIGTASNRMAGNVNSIAINGPIATANVLVGLVGLVGSPVISRNATFTGTTTTFTASSKSPTGTGGNASVVWGGTNAYVGTTGSDSAISVSTDGGINFNQIGLIDVGTVASMSLTSFTPVDNSNMLLIMSNITGGAYFTKHLYVTADGGTTWKRVLVGTGAAPVFGIASIAASPAYGTDKTFFVSQGAAGLMVMKTTDNGNSFTPMIASDNSTAIVAVDGTNYYYGGSSSPSFYKYGRFSNATFPVGVTGTVATISFNPKDTTKATIAVGMSDGFVYQSTNDGVSFTKVATTLTAVPVFVAYGPDGSLYAMCNATTGVVRQTGTTWLAIQTVAAGRGLVVTPDGTLYAADATVAAGVFRSLYPTLGDTTSVTATEFQPLNTTNFAGWGAAYAASELDVVNTATDNTLYVIETTTVAGTTVGYMGRIYGFKDTFIVGPTLTSPATAAQVTTQTTAALAWTAFTGATAYQVQVNSASAFTGTASTIATVTAVGAIADGRLTNSATAGITGAPLTGGNTYYWRIRNVSAQVAAAPINNINSRWATVRNFITALPPPVVTTIQMPTMGSVDVAIDTTFTWPTVAGTAVTYEFVIAEELGNADKFAIIDYSATTTTNAHKLRESLKYNTQYWWRVRAVTASSKSDWTVGFFTTAKAPPPPTTTPTSAAPTIIVPTQTIPPFPTPTVTVNVPAAEATEVIPTYIFWVVIAVGALLIIAVIVLIVRTRRIS